MAPRHRMKTTKKRTAPRVKRPRVAVKSSKRMSLAGDLSRLEDAVADLKARVEALEAPTSPDEAA